MSCFSLFVTGVFLRVVVDVVEIGERQAKLGEVLKVKPLAVLAMIDEGELDWKVVAISVDDPKADLVNNVADVEKHFPVSLLSLMSSFLTK
jgi:inorganic pyrophosphatase